MASDVKTRTPDECERLARRYRIMMIACIIIGFLALASAFVAIRYGIVWGAVVCVIIMAASASGADISDDLNDHWSMERSRQITNLAARRGGQKTETDDNAR